MASKKKYIVSIPKFQNAGKASNLPKPRAKNYDPLYTVKPQVSESTAVRNLPKQDKKVVEKTIAKKEAERKAVAKKIQANPLLTQAQKNEILLDPRKLDENVNLAYEKGPNTVKQVEPQSAASRAWEYITNPLTAAEYAISGGGVENMPRNINQMRMAGIDPGVVAGRNLVGNTLNTTANLFDAGDKVVRNIGEGNYGTAALEAMRFLPGARLNTGLGRYLNRGYNKIPTSFVEAGLTANKKLSSSENIYVPKSVIENPTASDLQSHLQKLGRTSNVEGEPINSSLKDKLFNFIKSSLAPIDQDLIMPLKYGSSIKKAKKYIADQKEYFKIPEVRTKLIEYGINPDELEKINFKIGNTGSKAYGNTLQFDPRQMKQIQKHGLMVNENSIIAHELGHTLGFNAAKNNKSFIPNKTISDLPINKDLYQEVVKGDYKYASPAHLLEYFTEGMHGSIPESYAHLREMKQNMINTGIINRLDQPVTEKQLMEFFSHDYATGKDRVSSMVDKANPNLIKFLSKELSNARVLVPTIGLGAAASGTASMQEQEYGGLFNYQSGGNSPCPPFYRYDPNTQQCIPLSEEEKASNSLEFMQNWVKSPMHNEMLKESIKKDNPAGNPDDYIQSISNLRLQATNPSLNLKKVNDTKEDIVGKMLPYDLYNANIKKENLTELEEENLTKFGLPLYLKDHSKSLDFIDPETNEYSSNLKGEATFYTIGKPGEHSYVYPHEISHGQDMGGGLIPFSDRQLIESYAFSPELENVYQSMRKERKLIYDKYKNSSPEMDKELNALYKKYYSQYGNRYNLDKKLYEEDFNKFKIQKNIDERLDNSLPYQEFIEKNLNKFSDPAMRHGYIANDSETRARLNAIRMYGKEAGIYDPFTEKLSQEKFKELREFFYKQNPNVLDTNQLRQLEEVYNEDQIFNMLNTISKNDNQNQDLSFAKRGGKIIKDQEGQRKHPGKITEIQGNLMATDGYGNIPLYVVPDVGEPKVVMPNTGVHEFKGATKFVEYPIKSTKAPKKLSSKEFIVIKSKVNKEIDQHINWLKDNDYPVEKAELDNMKKDLWRKYMPINTKL